MERYFNLALFRRLYGFRDLDTSATTVSASLARA